jgi:hypothetical protein
MKNVSFTLHKDALCHYNRTNNFKDNSIGIFYIGQLTEVTVPFSI